jgi:hypothetical protein
MYCWNICNIGSNGLGRDSRYEKYSLIWDIGAYCSNYCKISSQTLGVLSVGSGSAKYSSYRKLNGVYGSKSLITFHTSVLDCFDSFTTNYVAF